MKLLKHLALFALILVCCTPLVRGDGAVIFPYLSVESAKIVSVGAWFYMDVTNIWTETLNITMWTPFWFEEFNEYDTYGGFSSGSETLSVYVPFTIAPNETIRFHFHAPTKLHRDNDTVGIYPMEFVVNNVSGGMYSNKFTFRIQVITLKAYEPDYWKYEKEINFWKAWTEHWKQEAENWESKYLEPPTFSERERREIAVGLIGMLIGFFMGLGMVIFFKLCEPKKRVIEQ